MKTIILVATCAALAVSACATSSSEIASSYTSTMQYAPYDCQQIAMEEQQVLAHVSSLGGTIDRRATNDKIAVGVGVVLFWPALLFMKGNGEQTSEFARLKGESEALEHAAVMKHCAVDNRGQMASPAAQTALAFPPVGPVYSAAAYQQAPAPQYQMRAMASPAWAPPAQQGGGRVTDVRVSNGGSVTETTYAPN